MSESTPDVEPGITEDEAYALAVDENEPVDDLDADEETKRRQENTSEDF